ncbi:MAG: hypothetical protein NT090_26160 [Acidobacteria bacterium]|nr:hypothetical protein [Acidobacteriota bacterium]
MKALRIAGLLFLALPLWCQPKAVEVFGQIGYGNAYEDDGSLGSGIVYGGAVTLPLSPRWAVDLDVQHNRTTYDASTEYTFGTRRTLVSPAILYRRGSDRVYWFAGGGFGGRIDHMYGRNPGQPAYRVSEDGTTIPVRTGVVGGVTKHLLVRADLYFVFACLAPDAGVKLGIGYRF